MSTEETSTQTSDEGARTCIKCGSRHVMPKVRIVDHGDSNAAVRLTAALDRNPTALLFKNPLECPLFAVVCGECGYTEMYVEHPERLYEIYRQTSL